MGLKEGKRILLFVFRLPNAVSFLHHPYFDQSIHFSHAPFALPNVPTLCSAGERAPWAPTFAQCNRRIGNQSNQM